MYEIIRASIVLVCLFTLSGIIYKVLEYIFLYFKAKIEHNIVVRNIELERIKKNTELTAQINKLSKAEKKMLQMAAQKSSLWLPAVNEDVQLLLYKGFLKQISNVGKFYDWDNSGEREWCILVILSEEIRDIF